MENNNNVNNVGPWWKPAMQVFSEISVWISVPIILAVIVGNKLDVHYGTKPKLLAIFALVSFIISSFGIFRTVRKHADKIKKQMEQK
jgi:F0F1-type ATP synthase assembly protein I